MKTPNTTFDRSTVCNDSLMAKVMMLLAGTLVISSIGSYMGLGITSGWVLLGLFVATKALAQP